MQMGSTLRVADETFTRATADKNREVACGLADNTGRLLETLNRDFQLRLTRALRNRGYDDIRPAHNTILAHLGAGAVRVTELAKRAQVTQQAMGKTLRELERLGYVARNIDSGDKRAKAIALTPRGEALAKDSAYALAEVRQEYVRTLGGPLVETLEDILASAVKQLPRD